VSSGNGCCAAAMTGTSIPTRARAASHASGGFMRVGSESALPQSCMPKPEDTPLMQQWRDAKTRHPDALVFFRVGDFYEMFCEDAEEGARLLG
jgi:hypothetical protein